MRFRLFFVFCFLFFSFGSAAIIWEEDSDSVDFFIVQESFYCHNDVGDSYWSNSTADYDAMNDCYKPGEGFPSSTCCPSGFSCDMSLDTCVFDTTPINYCDDYGSDRNACENANSGIGNVTVFRDSGGKIYVGLSTYDAVTQCTEAVVDAYCYYDAVTGCDAGYKIDSGCVNPVDETVGECRFVVQDKDDDCENTGYVYYNTTATWTGTSSLGSLECVDSTSKVRCPNMVVRLPFFSFVGFVLSVVLLFFFYRFREE